MDPVTQSVVGATIPQVLSRPQTLLAATLCGALSGMAPDLDTLIRSGTDPLLYLQYHRQFTHSLAFIPLGSLICAILFYFLFGRRWQISFKLTYMFCFLGYGTHGLLDACTSYGTQLLWPFSDERFAWNVVSIIDPIFTLPLLALIGIGLLRRKPLFGKIALVWIAAYLGFGWLQNTRVEGVGYQLAADRGHTPVELSVKPSFANLLLWKVIYKVEGGYYTDAVRAGFILKVYPGAFIPALNIERDLPWLDPNSQQADDLKRFEWFSRGYLAMSPDNPYRVTDMRYSLVPNEGNGMWSIWFDPQADKKSHVRITPDRDTTQPKRDKFARMLRGEPFIE